jgi:fructoselysine-6-P-deglycase FrlB-like protein
VKLARRGGLGLPEPGERLAVVGCGTSWYMAQAYAGCREAVGQGWSDAFAASQCPDRSYDALLVLSRSGTTTEVLEVLDRFAGVRTIAVTANGDSPVAQRASHPVVLDDAAERSIIQTRFATTALALLRSSLGEDLSAAISDAEHAVDPGVPALPGAHRRLVFLGQGWSIGLANEAALKCREAAGVWTESYPAMEYRHGPISATTTDSLVWSLSRVPVGLDWDIAALGATLVESDLDPMAELIRIQRYAVALARKAGHNPDRPRGLAFSVVLDPDSVRGSR